ncbi:MULTISPECIES: winged helix domain-containing protein [unclassified Rhizobium]|uniref:winged helix domain-containing protein n=1 Tax=unclassified Rhizobium TaxID=2613769 RepID=UPI001ADBFFF1|nr:MULTISPECIES: hypothetical protein [unclassified Rhizobium]MBO9100345.1 hypothetical protein [Rhizobium sp. L58/93]MBO9186238.1 hypothetical protein [Rhizobium sp. E27B/91]QXZ83156.1 hypothetical protein J5287_13890 [Rhizobium sp. K1/93]QXZ89332.1 hypothetical protein J5280_14700 [Rhizobium sp. K15/93]QYA01920.1 hypothetical protein J5278_01640 [Rhizobium sp. B21/90]
MTQKLTITARILPDGATVKVIGRDAWALRNLVNAGSNGCTPIDNPAPRWSHYTWKLRRAGFVIETIDEKHGGPFAGSHARYVLRSQVQLLDDSDRRSAAA